LFPPRSRAASFPAGNNLRALVAMRFAEKPLLQQLLRRVRAFNVDSQLHGFVHFADSGGAATACSSQLRLFGLVVDQFSCPVVPAAEMKTLLVQRFPAGLTHDAVAVLVSHALRGEGNGLKARRTKAVHRHAGDRDRAAGAQCHLARNVGTRGALGVGTSHDDIVHFGGLDAGPGNRVLDGVAAQGGAMGHVERAFPAFGKRGAGGGDNNS
jgi:hypothetical protein